MGKGCYGNEYLPQEFFSNGSTRVVKDLLYEEGASPSSKISTVFWFKIDDYTSPSFFPLKNEEHKSGFQFILYKESTSMQEGIDSQGKYFLSVWNGLVWYGRLKAKPLGKCFAPWRKRSWTWPFTCCIFQSHQTLQCWCFGGMARNCPTMKIWQIKNLVKHIEEGQRLDTLSKETTFKWLDLENH